MSKFIGESISQDVIKQIEIREKTLGRDPEFVEYYYRYRASNSAWIRVTSGVDIVDENGTPNSNAAKNFILSGGILKWDGGKFIRNSDFLSEDNDSRYKNNELYGIRPEPGITSFSIQHKNALGTIREATIEFKVFTLEDMEKAENLFLRPGYTAICEWGNAGYVSNSGDFEDVTSTKKYAGLFGNDLKSVEDSLEENKINSSFNYDAFIGFITNFSWSYQPDGSFNCSIKVLSKGTILESLKIDTGNDSSTTLNASRIEEKYYSLSKPTTQQEDDEKPEITSSTNSELTQRRSLLDFFCFSVEDLFLGNRDRQGVLDYDTFNAITYSIKKKRLNTSSKEKNPLVQILKEEGITEQEFKVFGFNGRRSGTDKTIKSNKHRYISLRTFLALINASFISTIDKTFPKFSINYEDYKEYTTTDNHFSYDPSLVLLPKLPVDPKFQRTIKINKTRASNNLNFANIKVGTEEKFIFPQVFLNNTSENIISSVGETNKKSILNIFISTKLISTCLNRSFSPENIDTNTLFNFIKSVLKEINEVLGGINNLDVHYDDTNNRYTIVDRKQVNVNLKPDEIQIINFTGTNNTVVSLEQETKLSAELTSQLAISANPSNNSSISGNINFSFYNQGKIDRFKKDEFLREQQLEREQQPDFIGPTQGPVRTYGGFTEEELESAALKIEKEKQFLNNIYNAYMQFNNGEFNPLDTRSIYNRKLFDEIRGEVLSRTGDESDLQNGPIAFIPFPLTIKIDGISGLKIGQVFKLGDSNNLSPVLPSIYNRIAFIITGLNSSIEDGKWYTNIVALTYNLPKRKLNTSGD